MRHLILRLAMLNCLACCAIGLALAQSTSAPREGIQVVRGEAGWPGGRLVVSLRAEPKTLNPVTALDQPSRTAFSLLNADLVHINRGTQLTEPALAKSWKVSRDGLH